MTGAGEQQPTRLSPFHVAVPVHDLDAARAFYGGLLNCPEGRSDSTWVDFDLYGHQFVCHLDPGASNRPPAVTSLVDGDRVPVPHCGVVLPLDEWQRLAERLQAADIEFLVAPRTRFAGQPGEQGTLFIQDPSGNVLEFKGLRDLGRLFDHH